MGATNVAVGYGICTWLIIIAQLALLWARCVIFPLATTPPFPRTRITTQLLGPPPPPPPPPGRAQPAAAGTSGGFGALFGGF